MGILYLTLVYTRWLEQRTLWGLLYPTFKSHNYNSEGSYKEPSGDFVLQPKDQKKLVQRAQWRLCAATKGSETADTKSLVGTLYWREQRTKLGLLYPTFGTTFRIQKVGTRNNEPSEDFVLKLKDQKQLVQRA